MAVTATVEKFGMTFAEAYHKVNRLTYESNDQQTMVFSEEPLVDEDGNPIPDMGTPTWVKVTNIHFEVATYASETTREAHAEPIYRSYYNVTVDAEADLIAAAYTHLKAQAGYEDAVDC
jgi:hypothetical protein